MQGPSCRQWTHPHFFVSHLTTPKINLITREKLHTPANLRLFTLTRHTADSPLGFYALFHGDASRPVYHGLERGSDVTDTLWKALLRGMSHVAEFPSSCPLLILLPNRALLSHLTDLGKHKHLPQTSQFTGMLDDFVTESSPTEVHLFSPKWRNLPFALALAASMSEPCPPPPITSSATTRREHAFARWALDFDERSIPQHNAAWASITRPNGPLPPPFTCSALFSRNRRYFSACMQLTTRHCFDA